MIKIKETSIHEKLKTQLLTKIKKGKINDVLPTERVLAENYGVCRATVSKVMFELEREGYINRRRGKGTFIAPMDRPIVRQVLFKRSQQSEIIVAYQDGFSYVVWERVHLAEFMAMKYNLNLINLKLRQDSNLETIFDLVNQCQKLKGLILHNAPSAMQILQRLDNLNVPVVFLDYINTPTRVSLKKFNNLHIISANHYQAGYVKMQHLLEKGHRKIAYIRNEPKSHVTQINFSGIKQALYDHDMRLKDLIATPATKPGHNSSRAGYYLTLELLKKHRVSALVYDTLPGTLCGLKTLQELNLKCPEDISIISSSPDTEYIPELTHPVLTLVQNSNKKLIETAMQIILHPKKQQDKEILIDVKLEQGESVKDLNKP